MNSELHEQDIPTVPGELFAKFQARFYSAPAAAVSKALGRGVGSLEGHRASGGRAVMNCSWWPTLS